MSLNKAIYSKLTVLFQTVHAINVNARPARDYIWMNELGTMKGNLGQGVHYSTNEHKCVEFATAIADVQCEEIKEKLTKSKFISVIVDGSMDSATIDNEMVRKPQAGACL